jgi:hypothetical protein
MVLRQFLVDLDLGEGLLSSGEEFLVVDKWESAHTSRMRRPVHSAAPLL